MIEFSPYEEDPTLRAQHDAEVVERNLVRLEERQAAESKLIEDGKKFDAALAALDQVPYWIAFKDFAGAREVADFAVGLLACGMAEMNLPEVANESPKVQLPLFLQNAPLLAWRAQRADQMRTGVYEAHWGRPKRYDPKELNQRAYLYVTLPRRCQDLTVKGELLNASLGTENYSDKLAKDIDEFVKGACSIVSQDTYLGVKKRLELLKTALAAANFHEPDKRNVRPLVALDSYGCILDTAETLKSQKIKSLKYSAAHEFIRTSRFFGTMTNEELLQYIKKDHPNRAVSALLITSKYEEEQVDR